MSNKIFSEGDIGVYKSWKAKGENCNCPSCELREGYCMWNNKRDFQFVVFKDQKTMYGWDPVEIKYCNQVVDFKTTEKQCNMCSNRYYKKGRCYLKEDIQIAREEIPSDELATHRDISNPYFHETTLVHENGKACHCRAEYCEPAYPPCFDWIKVYRNGKLWSYTAYDIRPAGNELYFQETRYHIGFHENGKVSEIGTNTAGVQYFNEKGKLIEKCDWFGDSLIDKTCETYSKWQRKWITR